MARPPAVMRMRVLKPDFFKNDKLADLEHETGIHQFRLNVLGLFGVADDHGRFEWKPRRIAAEIHPYYERDRESVEPTMEKLVEVGRLQKYEVKGEWYGQFPHWDRHNSPSRQQGDSAFPAPPEGFGQLNAVNGRKGEERNGTERSEANVPIPPTNPELPLPVQKQEPVPPALRDPDINSDGHSNHRADDLGSGPEAAPQPMALPKRKLGFDPYAVEPFEDWTEAQIKLVVAYHWKYNESSFWREQTKSGEFFRRNFGKMAEQVPHGWKPPAPKTTLVWDRNCPNKCKEGKLRSKNEQGFLETRYCGCRKEVCVAAA
jgi:hypothetical protein